MPSPAAKDERTHTAAMLVDLLRSHYGVKLGSMDWSGGVFLPEVGINGQLTRDEAERFGARERRCDAIYAGFTSASGRQLVGHEIKISRSDWLLELRSLGKADFWHDNTHAWFVVAPSTDVVHPDELPHGWGLITPRGAGLARRVSAEVRAVTPSWTAMRSILSKAETLRASSVAAALTSERNRLSRIAKAQSSPVIAQPPVDPAAERVKALLREAYQRSGDFTGGPMALPDEMVIEALVDLRQAHASAARIRGRALNITRSLEEAAHSLASLQAHCAELSAALDNDKEKVNG